jgi:drug/metabolite transporter (DMT)-like permease
MQSSKTSSAPNALVPYIMLFGAQVAVGSAAVFARYALHGAEATMVSALRLTIAAVPLLVVQFTKRDRTKISRAEEMTLVISGVCLAVHFATWVESLRFTTVAISTLLVSTTPIWTALYAVVIGRKKMPPAFWYASVVLMIGVVLMNTGQSARAPVPGQEWYGCLLAVAGAIALATYLLVVKPILKKIGTLETVARTYSWAAVSLWIAALCQHQALPGPDQMAWTGIVGMAVVSQLIGHTGINASLHWFSANTVAVSTLAEPIAAAILAFFLFGEFFSWQGIIGAAMILVGLLKVLQLENGTSNE